MAERPGIPERIEAQRLYLRPYRAGDGPWYYAMSRKNHAHLLRYEPENVVMSVHSVEDAEDLVRDLYAEWEAQRTFFLGAFDRTTDEFVAQIYVGPADGRPAEFEIGYFADVDHEGRGFVTEAVRAVLPLLFRHLEAECVWLHCAETNVRSRRVAERCGLMLEEHLPGDEVNPDGTDGATMCYRLLKTEHVPEAVI